MYICIYESAYTWLGRCLRISAQSRLHWHHACKGSAVERGYHVVHGHIIGCRREGKGAVDGKPAETLPIISILECLAKGNVKSRLTSTSSRRNCIQSCRYTLRGKIDGFCHYANAANSRFLYRANNGNDWYVSHAHDIPPQSWAATAF